MLFLAILPVTFVTLIILYSNMASFFAIFQNLFFRVSTQIMSFEVVVYMKKSKGALVFWPFKVIPKISPCLLFWVINPFAKFSD